MSCDFCKKILGEYDAAYTINNKKYACFACCLKNENKLPKEIFHTCFICNTRFVYTDIIYPENTFCYHHQQPICTHCTRILIDLDAYRLELHCKYCIEKCDRCNFICCNNDTINHDKCDTSDEIPSIIRCLSCNKKLCTNCIKYSLDNDDIPMCEECILAIRDGYKCYYCDDDLENNWNKYGGFNMVCHDCLAKKDIDGFPNEQRKVSSVNKNCTNKQFLPEYMHLYND